MTLHEVRLDPDLYDEFGVKPEKVYIIQILNSNDDLKRNAPHFYKGPDLGVILENDGKKLAKQIEGIRINVGDLIRFVRKES